ncbi:hypothetical protein HZA33_01230 [Candidatus Pacearchaeota archaeon]|nr:hypothetical protein [Candidatus Pacearchaeota archaeon]
MVVDAMLDPLIVLWDSFITALPGAIAFIVILIVGYIIAWAVGKLVREALYRTKVDKWIKAELKWSVGHSGLSAIIGTIIRWWIFIVFFASAVQLLQLGVLSDMLVKLAGWLPNAIVAVVMLLFGWIAGDFVASRAKHEKIKAANLFGDLVKIVIVLFVGVMALGQMGIQLQLAEKTLLLIVAGIMLGVAIAIGIGFGNALKDSGTAKGIIEGIKKRV